MKFAKVLFFVCVIGICAAAAIERASSKAATEYTAATNALRLEAGSGYKEMFQNTNQGRFDIGNRVVSLEVDNVKVNAVYAADLLKGNSFFSGIPFYFATPPTSEVVTKNMVKLNEKTWYVPFNTISKDCEFTPNADTAEKMCLSCNLQNKSGTPVFKFFFSDMNSDKRKDQMLVSATANVISGKSGERKTFISNKFGEVADGLWEVTDYQEKIADIKKSDAEIKLRKETSIAKLKKQIAELTAKLALLQKQKTTLSGQLQTVQTTKSETINQRTKKITYRLSIEATIKTLSATISPAEQIKALTAAIEKALKELEYWLQGSIYHRVINATEKASLLAKKSENTVFDTMINDFFFPQ